MHEVLRVGYNAKFRSLRLTFADPKRCRSIARLLAVAKSKLLKNGVNIKTTFSVLSPPRFREKRNALYSMGLKMKSDRLIRRFDIIPHKESIAMRVRWENGDTSILKDGYDHEKRQCGYRKDNDMWKNDRDMWERMLAAEG